MLQYRLTPSLVIVVALLTAGCASTTLTNSWRAKDFQGSIESIVVVGVSKQASVRRVFEDEFATQLAGRGVQAIASYTLIPEDGPVDEQRLRDAIGSTSADAVIITRLVKVENKVSAAHAGPTWIPMHYPHYYGYYSSAWVGYYDLPVVHEYEVVTAETTVFVRGRAEPVWSGTTETFAPDDLRKETVGFAGVVMDALAAEGLI
jgi:hypothetical protein